MSRVVLAILFSLCCCFRTEAIVVQSAEQALSYKNVAKQGGSAVKVNKSTSTNAVVPPAVSSNKRQPETKEVDLIEKTSSSVNLYKGDSALVTVKEESGYVWKVKYDNSAVIFTNKGLSKGIRTFLFKQVKEKKDNDVYLDYIKKEDNSVVENKALFIKGK